MTDSERQACHAVATLRTALQLAPILGATNPAYRIGNNARRMLEMAEALLSESLGLPAVSEEESVQAELDAMTYAVGVQK